MYLLPPSIEFTTVKNRWVGNSVEECLKSWTRQKELKEWKVMPCPTIWDLYLAIKSYLFVDKFVVPSLQFSYQIISMAIAEALQASIHSRKERKMENLVLIKEKVWRFFYGQRKVPWDSSSVGCIFLN